MAGVILTSNLRFRHRLYQKRVPLSGASRELPVYTVEGLSSPCLAGLFRPAIYLSPEDARGERRLRHIVAHEESHRRGGDHIWSVLRMTALCLHWYNPLVWAAAAASKRDAELACDELTLRRLGGEERVAYGETLLSLTMLHPGAQELFSCSTAMAGGKKTLRERIEGIAHSRQTRAVAAFFAVSLAALALVFAFSQRSDSHASDDTAPFLQSVEDATAIHYFPSLYSSVFYVDPIEDADLLTEIKDLLSQLTPANDVAWPMEEDQYAIMLPGFTLLHETPDALGLDASPSYRMLNDRAAGRTLILSSTSDQALCDEDFTLLGQIPYYALSYTMENAARRQDLRNIGITPEEREKTVQSVAAYLRGLSEDDLNRTDYAAALLPALRDALDQIQSYVINSRDDNDNPLLTRFELTLADGSTIDFFFNSTGIPDVTDQLAIRLRSNAPHFSDTHPNGIDVKFYTHSQQLCDLLQALLSEYPDSGEVPSGPPVALGMTFHHQADPIPENEKASRGFSLDFQLDRSGDTSSSLIKDTQYLDELCLGRDETQQTYVSFSVGAALAQHAPALIDTLESCVTNSGGSVLRGAENANQEMRITINEQEMPITRVLKTDNGESAAYRFEFPCIINFADISQVSIHFGETD